MSTNSIPAAVSAPQPATTGTPERRTAAAERFHHLDALRGVLMMWGIFVHTSTLGDSVVFDNAARASGFVRMEAFFVVSGFLSQMMLMRYGTGKLLVKRFVSIGVPLVATLLLLNPVTLYLIYNFHNAPVGFLEYFRGEGVTGDNGPLVWHLHVWFLVTLLFYAFTTAPIHRIMEFVSGKVRDRSLPGGDLTSFVIMAGCVATCCVMGRVFFEFLLEPIVPGFMSFIVKRTLTSLPFFALGAVLYSRRELYTVFARPHWILTVVSLGLVYGVEWGFDRMPKAVAEAALLFSRSLAAYCLSSLLFCLFHWMFPRESRTARFLSDSAYTVFLFHFIVIYSLATLLRPYLAVNELFYWLVAGLTLLITLILHQYVITRVKLFRFLFNGRPMRRK